MKPNVVYNPSSRFTVNSNRIKPYILLVFTIFLALVLFFLVRDFLRTVIIGPLLYVIWFVTLIAESIPQGVIWAGFILLMMIIAFVSLRKREPEISPAGQPSSHNSGQVEKWARLLEFAKKDRFTKWRLANELKRLTRKLLSPLDDPELIQNHPDIPVEIIAFFEAQQPTKRPFWEWLNSSTTGETETALDFDPDVVIEFLEKRLKS